MSSEKYQPEDVKNGQELSSDGYTGYTNDETPIYHSFLGLKGKYLSWMVSLIAGVGFLLFGYDQGVMGSLLTLNHFRQQFPEIDATGDKSKSTYQGFVIGVYEIGCLAGALFTMWYGDKVGRRKAIFTGCVIMTIGAIIQCSSYSTDQLLVGRIVAGIGNGLNTSTVPVWQSECASPDKRGKLVMMQGALITGGIMISYWIDFGFYFVEHSSASWRFPIAFQIIFPVIILPIIMKLPESPRWLLKVGRTEEAIKVFSALEGVAHNDDFVKHEVQEVQTALAKESGERVRSQYKALFEQGPQRTFHRVCLAFFNQVMQQVTGINLITYYAGTIFENYIHMNALNSRILAACNGTEYFIASWVAFFTIEKFGRRNLMLFGAAGQAITMGILTGVNWAADNNNDSKAGVASAVFLFVFNTFFAIGWLGMTWLYPAEIAPLNVRAATNGLSTAANWSFNFMVVMITPVAFANIGPYTYTIFAAINALMVPVVYFFYPETAGRTLEEMDVIFENSDPKKPWDVVHQAKILPFEYKEGQFNDDLEKATASHTENAGIFEKPE